MAGRRTYENDLNELKQIIHINDSIRSRFNFFLNCYIGANQGLYASIRMEAHEFTEQPCFENI